MLLGHLAAGVIFWWILAHRASRLTQDSTEVNISVHKGGLDTSWKSLILSARVRTKGASLENY